MLKAAGSLRRGKMMMLHISAWGKRLTLLRANPNRSEAYSANSPHKKGRKKNNDLLTLAIYLQ